MGLQLNRILPGDKVMLEISPYDLSKGRNHISPKVAARTGSAFFRLVDMKSTTLSKKTLLKRVRS